MRQNTTSARNCLPFQCFHTCTAPGRDHNVAVLFVRGAPPQRLQISIVSFPQSEPVRTPMSYTGSSSGIHRFTAAVTLDPGNNYQRYCFKIVLVDEHGRGADAVWYSSPGMSRERPLLRHCFAYERFSTHPQWVTDLVLYHILPDKFAASGGHFSVDGTVIPADQPLPPKTFAYKDLDAVHCGGDLDGAAGMLHYLKDLGCSGICLGAVFSSPDVHKGHTADYDSVDAHFGGNGALKRLRTVASGYELKLLLRGNFASSSDGHPWFDRQERTGKGALRHKDSPYREYYTFTAEGEAVYARRCPNTPKLDYRSGQVRYAMYAGPNSVARKWLREPYGADGWVIDAAALLGDGGTARNNLLRLQELCQSARSTRLDALLIGDFTADARRALISQGNVDGSINYTGFISPIRAFFGGVDLTGAPTPYTGEDLRRTCEEYSVGVSQQVKLCLVNQLDNPDLPRFFTLINADRALYLAALAVLFTWRGIPCLYQGDELGDAIAQYQLGPHTPIPFIALKEHRVSPYSTEVQRCVRELAALRRANPALTLGSQIFVTAGGAHFGFCRLYADRFSLILVNAGRTQAKIDQGSMLLPLLAAMFMTADSRDEHPVAAGAETLLIPLSGRNVRRTDHGEGLEALYAMLARERLTVHAYGATRTTYDYEQRLLHELTQGKTLTVPPRTTVIVNNAAADK